MNWMKLTPEEEALNLLFPPEENSVEKLGRIHSGRVHSMGRYNCTTCGIEVDRLTETWDGTHDEVNCCRCNNCVNMGHCRCNS